MFGALLSGLVSWAARPLVLKVLLVAVPLLLASGGALAWYTVQLIEDRALVRAEADGWKIAALGWSREWEAEKARQAVTEAQRVARERERDAVRRQYAAARDQIARLQREVPPVRDYLAADLPDELDARLRDAETAAGAVR